MIGPDFRHAEHEEWIVEQHAVALNAIALYKARLRPLIRDAQLFHISDRPDGVGWDGVLGIQCDTRALSWRFGDRAMSRTTVFRSGDSTRKGHIVSISWMAAPPMPLFRAKQLMNKGADDASGTPELRADAFFESVSSLGSLSEGRTASTARGRLLPQFEESPKRP